MHKVLYQYRTNELTLNEVNLSLPTKDLLGARGFEVLDNFSEGYVVPMFKMGGELHYLFTMRPLGLNHLDSSKRFIETQELSEQRGIESLLEEGDIVDADHVFDVHPLLDDLGGKSYVQRTEEGLKKAIQKILLAKDKPFDYDSVIVFTNSGVGNSTTVKSQNDGVVRDSNGLGIGMRVGGEFKTAYAKGLEGAYQNTGKTHFHIVPIPKSLGGDLLGQFIEKIKNYHQVREEGTLVSYRNKTKETGQQDMGTISVAHVQNVDDPILFEHFSERSLGSGENVTPSSLAGDAFRQLYGGLRNIDFTDQETVETLRQKSILFYREKVV